MQFNFKRISFENNNLGFSLRICILKAVTVFLWKSDSEVSITHKFWKILGFFINMRSTQFGFSRFLSHVYHVKSVQIRSFFWSVFSRIRTEDGEIFRFSPYSVRMWENTDQKKLRIWTLHAVVGTFIRLFRWKPTQKCHMLLSSIDMFRSPIPGYFQTSKCTNPYYYLYYSNVTFSCRDDAPLSYNYRLNLSAFACRNFLFLLSHLPGLYLN